MATSLGGGGTTVGAAAAGDMGMQRNTLPHGQRTSIDSGTSWRMVNSVPFNAVAAFPLRARMVSRLGSASPTTPEIRMAGASSWRWNCCMPKLTWKDGEGSDVSPRKSM
eukprot:scaffold214625_cov30-Tisochrysis_lutea.AAC.3